MRVLVFVLFFTPCILLTTDLFSGERQNIPRDISVCIENVRAFPRLTVVIQNRCDKPVRVWSSGVPLGYSNLSFCVLYKNGSVGQICATKHRQWIHNPLVYDTLLPGEKLTRKVDLEDQREWDLPEDFIYINVRYVCTVYHIGVTEESVEKDVLMGVAVSPWVSTTSAAEKSPSQPEESKYSVQAIEAIPLISKAIFDYAKHNYKFPPACKTDANGKPLLSWRVLILPYLSEECKTLYEQFHLDEPWNSKHNKQYIAKIPPVYRSQDSAVWKEGKTNYLTIRGNKTMFPGSKGISLRDILDGTRNTIMTVEVSDERAVIWTKPDDFTYDESDPSKGLGLRSSGFLAGMADGSVRFFNLPIDPAALSALFTCGGGEPLSESVEGVPFIDKK